MTPKDKATELIDNFYQLFPFNKYVNTTDGELNWEYNDWHQSKQCALIAVDEMLDASIGYFDDLHPYVNFWQEVKQEIEKL
jgi:hypothetical protein